jgi:hypothetical protein
MRKLTITLTATAAFLCIGSLTWRAEAAPWLAASALRTAGETSAPIQKVHCWPGQYSTAGRGSMMVAGITGSRAIMVAAFPAYMDPDIEST